MNDMSMSNIHSDGAAERTNLTVEIVSAYVQDNSVPLADIPGLIRSVFDALSSLGGAAPEPVKEAPTPAVSPRKSIFPDRIVSLIDGKSYKSLKRHIATHGYTPASYRATFGLPTDYPMTCADFSAKRTELARAHGLGRKAAPVASIAGELGERVKNAEGIRELPPEQHEANKKGKRGRAKAAAEKASAEEGEDEALFERGRLDYLAGKPGMIPDDLQGAPKKGERYLEGWSAAQVQRSRENDAAEFERNPPKGSALPGADAPGSYEMTH